MNLIAIDIGNTTISIGLYLEGKEKSIETIDGDACEQLEECLKDYWQQIPVLASSKENKRDGVVVVSSVKPSWTDKIEKIVKELLGEKIYVMGDDIPLPIKLDMENPEKVGMDRIITASAAFAVVEKAVVVADFGTAVTIDLVDDRGVFVGGAILPGFAVSSKALSDNTAKLPEIVVKRPEYPFGKTTEEAINCGLYYAAIGALEEIIRRYSEVIGVWPETVITGSGAKVIKDDCPFIGSYVPNLVLQGIALAYRKYLEERAEQ